jgi:hypothetical protein
LAAYVLLKYRGRKRRKYIKHHQDQLYMHSQLEDVRNGNIHSDQMTNSQDKVSEKVLATEWLHRHQSRPVKVKFAPDGQVHVENRKGDRLRTITIKSVSAMLLEVTEDSTQDPLALLRIHKEHDLVLVFENMVVRRRFITILTQFLQVQSKELVITPTTHEEIFTTAETKEKRQQRLERFFKIAYARVGLLSFLYFILSFFPISALIDFSIYKSLITLLSFKICYLYYKDQLISLWDLQSLKEGF